MNLNYRKFIIMQYILEIVKNFQIENIDNGSQGGTHWACFVVKDNKTYYFDSFGVQPDEVLLYQLPKPIIYHNYKIQDINSQLYVSYCLYFFYLVERMNYYHAILKLVFE